MKNELAKKLKDAGFPLVEMVGTGGYYSDDRVNVSCLWCGQPISMVDGNYYKTPTLSELLEECGGRVSIEAVKDYYLDDVGMGEGFIAWPEGNYASLEFGTTHEEAVANLWLTLNKPK